MPISAVIAQIEARLVDIEIETAEFEEFAFDDVKSGYIDIELCKAARFEEVQYLIKRKIFDVCNVEEAWRVTGKAPISVRWVDTNKSDVGKEPDVRSRLVARDFKHKFDRDREDLFAATPPSEAVKAIFSKAAIKVPGKCEKKLLFIDARKAHLNPPCTEDVYIELPQEAGCGANTCGKLNFWLYGCRAAAQAWENWYASKFAETDFVRGEACPVIFRHHGRDVDCVVHGDDFIILGDHSQLDWITAKMHEWFEIKVRARIGASPADHKEVVILGRILQWHSWGLSLRADPRHRRLVLEHFGFGSSTKALSVNGIPETDAELEEIEEKLDKVQIHDYRAICARMNFASQDCPNIQFAIKELCRDMSSPSARSIQRLKRHARHWISWVDVSITFPWREEVDSLSVYVDSNWAVAYIVMACMGMACV